MHTCKSSEPSLGRLGRAIGAAALALASPAAIAAVIDSGVVNIAVPQTTAGIYLNVVTGASSTSASALPGWDFNPWGTTGLAFFGQSASGTGSVVSSGSLAAALNPGDVVGPSSLFSTGNATTAGTAFRNTGTAIVGFKFINEGTGATNYGYAEMSTTSGTGLPATIVRYVYENTGAAITIPGPVGIFRAYLDSAGNDANDCTLPAPCRLLPAALAKVRNGGEIWMLDSANYNTGTVTIDKSVTLLAVPGVVGSVVATGGGPALLVNNAGATVVLRNMVIVPFTTGSAGTNGVQVNAAAKLSIENTVIANLPGVGVSVNAPTSVFITDSTIRNNGGDGVWLQNGSRTTITRARISGNAATGVYVLATAGTTTVADVFDSTVDGNSFGVYVKSTTASAFAKVAVRRSQIVRQGGDGLTAEANAAVVSLSASDNVVSNNGTGIRAFLGQARVWASGNTVTNNGLGFHNDGGLAFESAGDNSVDGNTTPSTGTITTVGRQ